MCDSVIWRYGDADGSKPGRIVGHNEAGKVESLEAGYVRVRWENGVTGDYSRK